MGIFRRNQPRIYPTIATWPTGSYNVDIVGESFRYDNIHSIVGVYSADDSGEIYTQAQLIPEPDNPMDPDAILVTVDWKDVGYLAADENSEYARILTPILANRGQVLTAPARIWWGTTSDRRQIASVRLDLPPVDMFWPLNSPPPEPAFLLPRTTQYKVIDLDQDVIAPLLADREEVAFYATLTRKPNDFLYELDVNYEGVRIGHLSDRANEAMMGFAISLETSTVNLYCVATAKRGESKPTVKVRTTTDEAFLDRYPDQWETLQALFDEHPKQSDLPAAVGTQKDPAAPDLPAAQWYPDPYDQTQLRYWNGSEWTGHTHRY